MSHAKKIEFYFKSLWRNVLRYQVKIKKKLDNHIIQTVYLKKKDFLVYGHKSNLNDCGTQVLWLYIQIIRIKKIFLFEIRIQQIWLCLGMVWYKKFY